MPSCRFDYQIQDCESLDFDLKCRACRAGFTLSPDRSRCFIRPTPPSNPKHRIPNCFKFKTENYEECEICYEGYYLQDANTKCVAQTETIPGCNVLSQTEANRCVFCVNPYYRSNNTVVIANQCQERSNYFENCERYSRFGDKCLECAKDHIFHFNNSRCSPKIDSCNTYNTDQRILQCQDCIDSHYLNSEETQCFDAHNSINGCEKYAKGPSCARCVQGFYLDAETKSCFFHDAFLNCKSLSIDTKNVCDECEQQGVRTTKTHECTTVSNSVLAFDPNCVNWDESQKCIECITDYVLKNYTYLLEDGVTEKTELRCELERGCLEWSTSQPDAAGGCTKCNSEYYLYNFSCNRPNTENCMYSFEKAVARFNLDYGNNLESGFPCQICDEFRLFTVEQSTPEFRCVQATFFSDPEKVPNCLSFDKNVNGGYSCRECRRNHVLESNACNLRVYDADATYYYDQKDRIVRNSNNTASVSVTPANGGSSTNEVWPLNLADVPLEACDVYGPGLRYCLRLRNQWEEITVNNQNVNTEMKNYPYYDYSVYANYTETYIIGDEARYSGALVMDKSTLVGNFTTFKYYENTEDTGGTRKDQEPYIWYDTVPITKAYSAFIGYDPRSSTYSLKEEHADFKWVLGIETSGVKSDTTVCNGQIYMHDTLTTKDFSTMRINIDSTLIQSNDEPMKHLKKMTEAQVAPFVYPCDSTSAIQDCTSSFELIFGAERLMPFVSCHACISDYGVRLTQWKYQNYVAETTTFDHTVAETDCVKLQNSTDPNDARMPVVANCLYFERVLHHINNDIIHYCRACQPGAYPVFTEEAPRCISACADIDNGDGLTYECDDWYQCSVKCPASPCDFETSFCDTNAQTIGCEPKSKECCSDYTDNIVVDSSGNLVTNNSLYTCDDATRFKCRRQTCLNNCLDLSNNSVGLQCDTATSRCIPSPCADPDCTCLKGQCAAELCRKCTSETSTSTQYCQNSGGALSCTDYNLCESGNVCPPPCQATGTCNKGIFDGYLSDNSYSGNADYTFCNHYTGECTIVGRVDLKINLPAENDAGLRVRVQQFRGDRVLQREHGRDAELLQQELRKRETPPGLHLPGEQQLQQPGRLPRGRAPDLGRRRKREQTLRDRRRGHVPFKRQQPQRLRLGLVRDRIQQQADCGRQRPRCPVGGREHPGGFERSHGGGDRGHQLEYIQGECGHGLLGLRNG